MKAILFVYCLQAIPENIFIVAACNPRRGNSMVFLKDPDSNWMNSAYNVESLHPTLRFLLWDYGSLDENQEKDYINAKMKMVNITISNLEVCCIPKIVDSFSSAAINNYL